MESFCNVSSLTIMKDVNVYSVNESYVDPFNFFGTEFSPVGEGSFETRRTIKENEKGAENDKLKEKENENEKEREKNGSSRFCVKKKLKKTQSVREFARSVSSCSLNPIIVQAEKKLDCKPNRLCSLQKRASQSSILIQEQLRRPSSKDLSLALRQQLQEDFKNPDIYLTEIVPEINEFEQVEEHFSSELTFGDDENEETEIKKNTNLLKKKSTLIFQLPNSVISVLEAQMNTTNFYADDLNYGSDEDDEEAYELPQGDLADLELDRFLGFGEFKRENSFQTSKNFFDDQNTNESSNGQQNQYLGYDIYPNDIPDFIRMEPDIESEEEFQQDQDKGIIIKNKKKKKKKGGKGKKKKKKKTNTKNDKGKDKCKDEGNDQKPIYDIHEPEGDRRKREYQEKLKEQGNHSNQNGILQEKEKKKERNKEKSKNKKKKTKYKIKIKSKEIEKINSCALQRQNSSVVETGKDVFKLMSGQLWVIMGGGSMKILKPYTNQFADKIGAVFNANQKEVQSIKKQLKYLLSNSRRTFTEFVLEIFLGVLSLAFSETIPKITNEFWEVLEELYELDHSPKADKTKNKSEDQKKPDEINLKLEKLFHKIYPQHVLMYWFNKRFSDRLSQFFLIKDQSIFFERHLFYLGKSKFLLSCMLLAKDLMNRKKEIESYYHLITCPYNNDPMNLYFHNRGTKLKIVRELVQEFGVNNGEYWGIISKDYVSKMSFRKDNVLQTFPFQNLITNPKLASLCRNTFDQSPLKSRKKPSQLQENETNIKTEWITKKK